MLNAPYYRAVDGLRGSRQSYPTLDAARERARWLWEYHNGKRNVRVVGTVEELPANASQQGSRDVEQPGPSA